MIYVGATSFLLCRQYNKIFKLFSAVSNGCLAGEGDSVEVTVEAKGQICQINIKTLF